MFNFFHMVTATVMTTKKFRLWQQRNVNVKLDKSAFLKKSLVIHSIQVFKFIWNHKTKMALLDYCNLNEKINLKPVDALASFPNDIIGYSENFIHSAQLATPPFANVSKGYNRLYSLITTLELVHNCLIIILAAYRNPCAVQPAGWDWQSYQNPVRPWYHNSWLPLPGKMAPFEHFDHKLNWKITINLSLLLWFFKMPSHCVWHRNYNCLMK